MNEERLENGLEIKTNEEFMVAKKGEKYYDYFRRMNLNNNTVYVMLDTGNEDLINMRRFPNCVVLDHHHFVGEEKNETKSATHVLLKKKKEYMDKVKNYKNIVYITHDNPDIDAINSVTLARLYKTVADMETMSEKDKEFVRIAETNLTIAANAADCFKIQTELGYQSLLNRFIENEYPKILGNRLDVISSSVKSDTIKMLSNVNYEFIKENALENINGNSKHIDETTRDILHTSSHEIEFFKSDILQEKYKNLQTCSEQINQSNYFLKKQMQDYIGNVYNPLDADTLKKKRKN